MAIIAVVTTVGSRDEARTMARTLVERRLVACAQISEIESFYCWDGATQNEPEFHLLLKTREDRYDAVEKAIRTLHSYQVPAIYAHALVHVDAAFAQWVEAQTRDEGLP